MAPAKSKRTITHMLTKTNEFEKDERTIVHTTLTAKNVHNNNAMPPPTGHGQAASRGTAGANFTTTKRQKPKPLIEPDYVEATQQELPDELLPDRYSGRTNNVATITKHVQGRGKGEPKYPQKIYSDFIPSVLNQVENLSQVDTPIAILSTSAEKCPYAFSPSSTPTTEDHTAIIPQEEPSQELQYEVRKIISQQVQNKQHEVHRDTSQSSSYEFSELEEDVDDARDDPTYQPISEEPSTTPMLAKTRERKRPKRVRIGADVDGMAGIEEMDKSAYRESRVSITTDREPGERYTSNDSMLTEGGLLAYGEGSMELRNQEEPEEAIRHTPDRAVLIDITQACYMFTTDHSGTCVAYMTDFDPFIARGQTVGHTTPGEVYRLSSQISSSGLELLAIKASNGWIQGWVDPNEENCEIIQRFLLCRHTILLKLAWQYQQTVLGGKGKRYIGSCSWIATCDHRDGKGSDIGDSQTEELDIASGQSSGPLEVDEHKSSSLPFHQSTSPVSRLFNKDGMEIGYN
ncbi:hypothetical protein BJ508DRAFT_315753 [Ascobolus immersus RN42]|uniref:Uncharacterized protein n=1 Tax=Ascobolus immersus RN42 TaxID=1160509 RepID=A0A3N4H9G0_ASCIM|nr:hypothetical protein BJ508DRAFT_315753 [Ascobolus immersus RN42]